MKLSNDKSRESREREFKAFLERQAEAKKKIEPVMTDFLNSLATEGDRSAVVLGAERINVSLEQLLKRFLRPSSNKDDELFGVDKALATFSRKIEMAYRIGLVDLGFKKALNLVRKLRNDFAHATTVETLEQQKYLDRVKALRDMFIEEDSFRAMSSEFKSANPQSKTYLSCVLILLLKLELVAYHLERPEIMLPAKINYADPD